MGTQGKSLSEQKVQLVHAILEKNIFGSNMKEIY